MTWRRGGAVIGARGRCLLWVVAAVALLIVTQITRFTSTVRISVRAGMLSASIAHSSTTSPLQPGEFRGVRIQTQHSMLGRGMLSAFLLERPGQMPLRRDFSGLYLLGEPFPSPVEPFSGEGFQPSFGDWTQDRYDTPSTRIFAGPLGESFDITATFLGRGDHFIVLEGTPELRVYHRDGFMDNDFSVCYPDRCLYVTTTSESLSANAFRILNLLSEGMLIAVLVALAVELLNSIAKFWVLPGATESGLQEWRQFCLIWSDKESYRRAILALLVVLQLALGGYASYILEAVPHVPESTAPYRSGALLADGMFGVSAEEASRVKVAASELASQDSRLFFKTGHFWPVLLAPFVVLGWPAVANMLFTAANTIFIFLIGRRDFGVGAAIIGAVVYALSPLSILMAGEYLPGPATLTILLVCWYALGQIAGRHRILWLLVGGASWTYALGLRPYAGWAALPLVLWSLFRLASWRGSGWNLGVFFLGAAPVGALLLVDNKLTTSGYLGFPDSVYRNLDLNLNNIWTGINYADSTLAFFVQMIFSTPVILFPVGLSCYAVLVRLDRKIAILVCGVMSFVVTHFLVGAHGLHAYGPRFFYEALAPLSLLIGIGAQEMVCRLGGPNRKVLGIFFLFLLLLTDLIRVVSLLPRYHRYNGIDGASFSPTIISPY